MFLDDVTPSAPPEEVIRGLTRTEGSSLFRPTVADSFRPRHTPACISQNLAGVMIG